MISSKKKKIGEMSQTPSSSLHLNEWSRYFRHRDTIKLSNPFKDYSILPMLSGETPCCIKCT